MLIPNLNIPENIKHESHNVEAYLNQKHLGSGSLYIAESHVFWSKENSGEGLSLQYPNIAIHAVSRDTTNFQFPCLYLMLDIDIDSAHSSSDESDDENEEKMEMTELRFVPRDDSLLDTMYKSLNDCLILHPDADNILEDGQDGYFEAHDDDAGEFNEAVMEEGTENGGLNGISNNENANGDDDVEMGQFDDVDS